MGDQPASIHVEGLCARLSDPERFVDAADEAITTLRALAAQLAAARAEITRLSTPDLFGSPNGDCGYERSDLWCVAIDEMGMRVGEIRACGWANRVLDAGWLAVLPVDDDGDSDVEWFATREEAEAAMHTAIDAAKGGA